jgi:hypothetical protein
MASIEEYRFGHIVIDGESYDKDVIILPDRVQPNWWRKDGHSLHIEDFDVVEGELPDHLVVGAGAHHQMHPEPKTISKLEARGITVEVLDTTAAVRRYSELEPATTAAALHLTC